MRHNKLSGARILGEGAAFLGTISELGESAGEAIFGEMGGGDGSSSARGGDHDPPKMKD